MPCGAVNVQGSCASPPRRRELRGQPTLPRIAAATAAATAIGKRLRTGDDLRTGGPRGGATAGAPTRAAAAHSKSVASPARPPAAAAAMAAPPHSPPVGDHAACDVYVPPVSGSAGTAPRRSLRPSSSAAEAQGRTPNESRRPVATSRPPPAPPPLLRGRVGGRVGAGWGEGGWGGARPAACAARNPDRRGPSAWLGAAAPAGRQAAAARPTTRQALVRLGRLAPGSRSASCVPERPAQLRLRIGRLLVGPRHLNPSLARPPPHPVPCAARRRTFGAARAPLADLSLECRLHLLGVALLPVRLRRLQAHDRLLVLADERLRTLQLRARRMQLRAGRLEPAPQPPRLLRGTALLSGRDPRLGRARVLQQRGLRQQLRRRRPPAARLAAAHHGSARPPPLGSSGDC